MARRRTHRREDPREHGLSLQDLLSNALGAVIVLTLIAAAITGTGRSFLRTQERAKPQPEETDLVEWREPEPIPEETDEETVLVEVELALDTAEDRPLLRAESRAGAGDGPTRLFSPGRRQAYALLLPITDGRLWSITLSEPGRVSRLAIRVHAGATLVRESDWAQPVPRCAGGTTILTLCRPEAAAPIRTSLVMACSASSGCE